MTEPTELEIITKAREILNDKKNWMKGDITRTGISMFSVRDGECFCLIGGIAKAKLELSSDSPSELDSAYTYAENECIGLIPCIINVIKNIRAESATLLNDASLSSLTSEEAVFLTFRFNDDRLVGHKNVLDVLDCRIAKLKEPT